MVIFSRIQRLRLPVAPVSIFLCSLPRFLPRTSPRIDPPNEFGNNAQLRASVDYSTACRTWLQPACAVFSVFPATRTSWRSELCRRHSRINQLNHQNNCRTISKVLLDQLLPLLDCRFSCFCISKTGQIDKKERSVKPIKIDALSFARSRTGSGQFLVAGQPVNQAGFPDIGPACKNYFRNSLLREITFRDGADDKFGLDHWKSCGIRFSARRSRSDECPRYPASGTPAWGQAAVPGLSAGLHPLFPPD